MKQNLTEKQHPFITIPGESICRMTRMYMSRTLPALAGRAAGKLCHVNVLGSND